MRPSLPGDWYHDPAQYARELEAIWYRDWLCIGRLEDLSAAGDFLVAEIGSQSVVVTRDRAGGLHAFHNTCRHRGSQLCQEPRGRFAGARIVCPYHAWSYALSGELLATPAMELPEDFRREDWSLYRVPVDAWGGFLFVNLDERPAATLVEFLGEEAANLRRWPLAELVSVQREATTLACNWKVFWENYSECYHCPGVHPELCRIMPLYREGLLSAADRRGAQAGAAGDPRARVAPGLATWTLDGRSTLPLIEGPGAEERALGVVFASFTASFFIVAHPDYVRSVRVLPLGPERVSLTVDWLLPPGVAEAHPGELERLTALGRLVVAQDGRVCELNQAGLRSRRHREGVLMPQEHGVQEFHEWLRSRLGA